MSDLLFSINGIDFTRHITAPSYEVNEESVYNEWTDANKDTHRDVIRNRVSGSFDVIFDNEPDLNTFINMINDKDKSDRVEATVYINNKAVVATKKFFIDFKPKNSIPFFGRKPFETATVEITEA